MVPNLGIFVLSQNFAITQIPGCWFQIWQHCFQIPAKKIPKWRVFSPKYKDFYFRTKLLFWQNWRVLISNMTMAFSNLSPNNQIPPQKSKFCTKCKYFYFCKRFRIMKNLRIQIFRMTIVFSNSSLKIPKNDIFCEKSSFFFTWNFVWT